MVKTMSGYAHACHYNAETVTEPGRGPPPPPTSTVNPPGSSPGQTVPVPGAASPFQCCRRLGLDDRTPGTSSAVAFQVCRAKLTEQRPTVRAELDMIGSEVPLALRVGEVPIVGVADPAGESKATGTTEEGEPLGSVLPIIQPITHAPQDTTRPPSGVS